MALAAIIIADDGSDSEPVTVLGRPVIEALLGRAVAVGARHIVVLTQRVPPALLAAADRVRAQGIGVDLARGIADAVDRVHPDETLLILPPHIFVPDAALRALLAAPAPALLVTGRDAAPPGCELIDADHAATGHAVTDGTALRAVAATLGEWDLGATLRRALVQRAASRVMVDPDLVAVLNRAGADAVGRILLGTAVRAPGGIGGWLAIDPLAKPLARRIAEAGGSDYLIGIAAGGIGVGGAVAALAGFGVVAAAMIVIAALLLAIARLIGRSMSVSEHRRAAAFIDASAIVAMGGVAAWLYGQTGQWGAIAMAAGAAITVVQGQRAGAWLPNDRRRWLADLPASAATIGVGLLTPWPELFVVTVAAYATAGLAVAVELARWQGLAPR